MVFDVNWEHFFPLFFAYFILFTFVRNIIYYKEKKSRVHHQSKHCCTYKIRFAYNLLVQWKVNRSFQCRIVFTFKKEKTFILAKKNEIIDCVAFWFSIKFFSIEHSSQDFAFCLQLYALNLLYFHALANVY